jgi:hypothetical protein
VDSPGDEGGEGESSGRQRQGDHEGRPLKRQDRTQGDADDHQYAEPERARERFDPFAGVEDRAVPGEDLVDDPEVDERVLVRPAATAGRAVRTFRATRPLREPTTCVLLGSS